MNSACKELMSLHTIVLRKFTRVLVKKQLGSQQRQLGKTVGKDSGYKSGGLHCVYG